MQWGDEEKQLLGDSLIAAIIVFCILYAFNQSV